MKDNMLSENEIIEQAIAVVDTSDNPPQTVLDACEVFYMNGSYDDQDGDVETYDHFYRVHRWIVFTNNQGFKDLDTYDNEDEAIEAFEKYSMEYAATLEVDECF